MSTVWVVNYAGHDYTPAKRFGKIEHMTQGYISRGNTERLNYRIAEIVAETDPDDWLLPSGLMTLNILAALFWMEHHGHVKMLVHDPKEGEYNPVRLSGEQVHDLLTVVTEAQDGGPPESYSEAAEG